CPLANDHGTVKDRHPMKTQRKSARHKASPTLQNGTVPPPRRSNRDVRPREYLTPKEVERLIEFLGQGASRLRRNRWRRSLHPQDGTLPDERIMLRLAAVRYR